MKTLSGSRVTVVTAGNLSTCPRMLKAADALADAGYRVRVVSTDNASWATQADAAIRQTRHWDWSVVNYGRETAPAVRLKTGVRFRAMQAIASVAAPSRVPTAVAIRAYGRVHDELVEQIAAQPCDLVYGGTTGALAAVADGARRLRVPHGIDFEDFHSGEGSGPGSELANALAARVEQLVIRGATFVTGGSSMIAEAYRERYGIPVIPIHNTFSVEPVTATGGADGPLRLYWFSQTLGAGRGLEDVIRAAGDAHVDVELHLRARPIPE